MSNTLIFDCPHCGATNNTFDVNGYNIKSHQSYEVWEIFAICRTCKTASCITATIRSDVLSNVKLDLKKVHSSTYRIVVESIKEGNCDLGDYFENYTLKTVIPNSTLPPEHLPDHVRNIFNEGAKCLALSCFNAAGAMFRLCLDITTRHLLEENQHLKPSSNDNRSIHNRLTWIFNNNVLPRSLEDLSRCIKDDGNDAAHDGNLGKIEADDLFDFTNALLEQVYTQPEKVRIARERRQERRNS